jgi:lipopolysaccharide/colanic/teichoic acid biosynthesis glycosyltransferase
MKRLFDVALAGAGTIGLLPVAALIAIAIKLEDGGPVLFVQPRVGRLGRIFTVWKFRSMRVDAESGTGAVQARRGDPRVTRVGRWLRATALDELPQLWNILRGDMSFVGPRPLRPNEIDTTASGTLVALSTIPGYVERHSVRPGLTGLAQVVAARDIPRTHKFRYDCLYAERAGLCLDMALIARSVLITLRGDWENVGRRRR